MVDHTIKIEPGKLGLVLGSSARPPVPKDDAKDKPQVK